MSNKLPNLNDIYNNGAIVDENNRIYYHYCSLDTMLSILKNELFYLSDPLKMNDSQELTNYFTQLGSITHRNSKLFNNNILSKEKVYNYFKEIGNSNVFIGSFTYESDSLYQWISYGDNSKGVAMGFNLNQISKCNLKLSNEKVIYQDLTCPFKEFRDIEEELCKQFENENIDDAKKLYITMKKLMPYIARYKNTSFSSEKERRLIYNDDDNYLNENAPIHEFRTTKYKDITEYIKLDINLKSIKKIVIGPTSNVNENTIKKILNRYALQDVKIEKSKSTYR